MDTFGGVFTKKFSKDNRLTIMLITFSITLICEIISYLIQIIAFSISVDIIAFLKIVLIEALYNVIIVIIIYPLIEKFGDLLMKTFKEKNIFTKYY